MYHYFANEKNYDILTRLIIQLPRVTNGGVFLTITSTFFHQIVLFYRPFETKLNAVLAQHNLHRAQWATLYYLEKNDSMTLVELADLQGVEKPTVSRTVAKLIASGLLTTIETQDKRQKRLILTPSGQALYQAVRIPIDEFETAVMAGVSEDKQLEMIELLQSLREKI
ncbi:MarR family transcriptional regulator [Kurthia sibirica]|uniref:MarR family transcriptional regulator n=1 Tax=Kurthia sibirica TaxID=202750 RepID=A0A2U3AMA4_9BACL|nr:MarR family transcriptional regulator [Kurthia sibirica]